MFSPSRPPKTVVVALAFITLLSISIVTPTLAASEDAAQVGPKRLHRATMAPPGARIVNGIGTNLFPSTVALLTPQGSPFCSGTLIGCSTVLTASHCVCTSTGANCGQGQQDLTSPSDVYVFLQHAGIFAVSKVLVPPNYVFGADADVAILELAAPVQGVAPSGINDNFRLGTGSQALLVGFGLSNGAADDSGIKRYGLVTTSPCTQVPDSEHVCWQFQSPVGAPGQDSNTCPGDSGGPLFANFGSGLDVAGVTSGGISQSCLPPDSSWDADVFVERTWISNQAGADLSSASCGDFGPAGSALGEIFIGEGNVSQAEPSDQWIHTVIENTTVARFMLNGEEGGGNDFDFYVKRGSAASTTDFDCKSENPGNFEGCEILNPQVDDYYVLVQRFAGQGDYQLSATSLADGIFADGFESGNVSAWSQ